MAKCIGSKPKIARKLDEPIFGANKIPSKKSCPPGQHGNNRCRRQSEYAFQLHKKQTAKCAYGVLECRFRNLFEKAQRTSGITGEILLQLPEPRLDNVVFRLGIAPTRAAARRLVFHRHIVIDGEMVSIPSCTLKPRQIVGVRERDRSMKVIAGPLAGYNHNKYPWLGWDACTYSGKHLNVPTHEKIPEPIEERPIVELYFR